MIVIKKAGAEYIPVIKQLAEITWAVAYNSILSPEQMQYMLQLFYSERSLQEQMDKGHQFIIAFDDSVAVGFAAYSPKKINSTDVYRLHKLYIDPQQQVKGFGKILLNFIIDDIKPAPARILELNVNRYNTALGFYQRSGFVITGEEDIDIGNGYFMNDYVMEKVI